MYTQELGLQEELAIVDEIQLINEVEINQDYVLVPNNKAEVFFALNGNLQFKSLGSVRSLTIEANESVFMKPRRRGAELTIDKGTSCLMIKLNPIYAKKISENLEEISNGIFAFKMASIQHRFLDADIYDASDAIREFFYAKTDLFDYNFTIIDSIDRIKNSCGTVSVKEIYNTLNVSKSKLEQHFNREIGLTPKEFCKIEKINCFINSYVSNPNQSLTELTYQCGYYDQSHLIKDFKYFLDTSPKKYFNSEYTI
ncbi:helix-turn-helix domain-containing protein [Ekhidna sp.]|uniref:helix-turn-helix domain-containing protein n=1 Tax=Ekhidna sp. TaxID=2608089 RepID=UPI003B50925F